jgi:4-alpha-glucanotransferase
MYCFGERTTDELTELAKSLDSRMLAAIVCGEDAGSVRAGVAERELNKRGFFGSEIDKLR